MRLIPKDVARYLYCPLLPKSSDNLIYNELSLFESSVGEAIRIAEHRCLLNEVEVTPRRIMKAWDSNWWPTCAHNNISFKEAQKKTIEAGPYFVDYCKYDLSDFLHPTIATDVDAQVNLGQSVLHAHIDIIKTDLTIKNKNILLIDFSKKGMSTSDTGLDPGIASNAIAFYTGSGETIRYILVQIDERSKKLFTTQAIFRPDNIKNIRNMVFYVENSIRKGVLYGDRWKCKECKACPSFKYLMKNDILLKQ